jgi:hypothetical protein
MDIPGINMSMEFSRLHLSMVAIIMRIPVPILWNAGHIHNELTSWEKAQPMIIFLCIPDAIRHRAFCNIKKGARFIEWKPKFTKQGFYGLITFQIRSAHWRKVCFEANPSQSRVLPQYPRNSVTTVKALGTGVGSVQEEGARNLSRHI